MSLGIDCSLPLAGWTVLSLRPRGQHGSLRAAAARLGARTLALSPHAIETHDDKATRDALRQAMAADIVLFTSPNAVRSAHALQALSARRRQTVLAVGSGTRNALRRLGIGALAPTRMDSEGLLGMPALGDVGGRKVGLVTGAGGRNLLAPALRGRGAALVRADTYRRVPAPLPPRMHAALATALASSSRLLLVLSSAEACQQVLVQLTPPLQERLSSIAVVAASPRLAKAARDAGFRRIAIAPSARPAALLHAAAEAFV